MREAVKTYMAGLDKQLDATPFGVPPSLGTWGGSGAVVDMAIRMYFLHKAFPDLVSPNTHFAPSTTFSARTRYPALRM
jgi:endoglucanase